jgi:hypothetical protein
MVLGAVVTVGAGGCAGAGISATVQQAQTAVSNAQKVYAATTQAAAAAAVIAGAPGASVTTQQALTTAQNAEATAKNVLDAAQGVLSAVQNHNAEDPQLLSALRNLAALIPGPWGLVIGALIPFGAAIVGSLVAGRQVSKAHAASAAATQQAMAK